LFKTDFKENKIPF